MYGYGIPILFWRLLWVVTSETFLRDSYPKDVTRKISFVLPRKLSPHNLSQSPLIPLAKSDTNRRGNLPILRQLHRLIEIFLFKVIPISIYIYSPRCIRVSIPFCLVGVHATRETSNCKYVAFVRHCLTIFIYIRSLYWMGVSVNIKGCTTPLK